jgi:hypothetical protein
MKKLFWQVVLAAVMALLVQDFGKPDGYLLNSGDCTTLGVKWAEDGAVLTVDSAGVPAWTNHPEMGHITVTTGGPIYEQVNDNLTFTEGGADSTWDVTVESEVHD